MIGDEDEEKRFDKISSFCALCARPAAAAPRQVDLMDFLFPLFLLLFIPLS